jgi:serine/threonine protein kinase
MVHVRHWDPDRIGPYAIITRLGAGAMGQVYLGRSTAGRLVAVKTIKPELAEEEGFRTRFAQEVAAARKVSGVFTAAVVEADSDADLPWLATAYVPAPSLLALVHARGPLPAPTVRWLAAGCAEALDSIHRAGLVHMDLKPSNVLVATDGPRVIDFGVARATSRVGYARGPVGTPAYMAPEQAQDATQVTAASDMFSLGATLLYAATGHPPYRGETSADVLVRLATELPDLTGLPAELTGLVTDCLERAPLRRPSAELLLARLGEFTEPRSYLPEPALAFIREYSRGNPKHGAVDGDSEQTDESYPGLPATAKPDVPPPSLRSWRHAWRRTPSWAGWALAGAVLISAGVVLGATLTSSGVPATKTVTTGDAPPPPLPDNLGPVCGPQVPPGLCVNENLGYASTRFAVQDTRLQPGKNVTLTVTFYPPQSTVGQVLRTVTMRSGRSLTFGQLALGEYQITVPGGSVARFAVLPASAPLP